jgi:hypothetical protein
MFAALSLCLRPGILDRELPFLPVVEQETLATETKNLRTTLLARVAHLQLLDSFTGLMLSVSNKFARCIQVREGSLPFAWRHPARGARRSLASSVATLPRLPQCTRGVRSVRLSHRASWPPRRNLLRLRTPERRCDHRRFGRVSPVDGCSPETGRRGGRRWRLHRASRRLSHWSKRHPIRSPHRRGRAARAGR